MSRKLFITGGAGFIGSNFIRYWREKHPKDAIVNFDALTYAGNLENLEGIREDGHYTFVRGNICDYELVNKTMDGCDIVVHFAAESHVDRSILGPRVFLQTNVMGTQSLLDAALEHHVKRFHHISTDEVYGSLPPGSSSKFSENTPYDPSNPYSASKAASDHLVRSYFRTYGLGITITNCSNNFGPRQFPEKFIPLAITNLMEGRKVPLYGDGKYVRDWLYVDDHSRAVEKVLLNGTVGETYCVGGLTRDVSNLEVARKILKLFGKGEECIDFVKDRPGHDRRYAVDWSKIRLELGFSPEHDFDEYLNMTVSWYKENASWWRKVKSGEYKTYYKKQYETT